MIGSDQETDLAVIKIDVSKPLPAAQAGNIRQPCRLATGSSRLVVLGRTVTAGIVSAIGRSIVPNRQFQSFIQTDAAINPGNSGGPLVNMAGEIIGIEFGNSYQNQFLRRAGICHALKYNQPGLQPADQGPAIKWRADQLR